MNKVLFTGLTSLVVLISGLTPVSAEYPIAPAGSPALNPDGTLVNPPIVLPPGFQPGDPAPLPPPLFNPDGTPFVIGTPLDMPVRADGTRLSYEFDSLTGLYVPVTRVANEPVPPTGPAVPIYNLSLIHI